MDEDTATKVPHTGSFFNSPPDCSKGAWRGLVATLPGENARMINSTTWRMNNVKMKTRISRKTFRNMRRTQGSRPYFFFAAFFAGALGFLYSVAICPSIIVIIPLADSA